LSPRVQFDATSCDLNLRPVEFEVFPRIIRRAINTLTNFDRVAIIGSWVMTESL